MHRKFSFVFPVLFALLAIAIPMNSQAQNTDAPKAKKIKHELKEHGNVRVDDYFWMRLSDEQKNAEKPDAQTQDVLDYLNAENAYTKKVMGHTDQLQKELFDEIVGPNQAG